MKTLPLYLLLQEMVFEDNRINRAVLAKTIQTKVIDLLSEQVSDTVKKIDDKILVSTLRVYGLPESIPGLSGEEEYLALKDMLFNYTS